MFLNSRPTCCDYMRYAAPIRWNSSLHEWQTIVGPSMQWRRIDFCPRCYTPTSVYSPHEYITPFESTGT